MTMAMGRCPVEMWSQIFTFACTDNGFTGRSLSLTSRYFHEASKPFKLQSLSVTTTRQILGLAHLISTTPPMYRKVRYLFIANRPMAQDDQSSQAATKLSLLHFMYILARVAPTLAILHVDFIAPFSFTSFMILPSLTELIVIGGTFDLVFEPMSLNTSTREYVEFKNLPDHRPPFPSLRRLRLAGHRNLAKCIQHLLRVAPSLTHLCLPRGRPSSQTLITILKSTLPSNLKLVSVVECVTPNNQSGTVYTRDVAGLAEFRVILKLDQNKIVQMFEEQQKGRDDVERDWLASVEGGDLPWTVRRGPVEAAWA